MFQGDVYMRRATMPSLRRGITNCRPALGSYEIAAPPVEAAASLLPRQPMRLVIERGELLRALGHVTSVVERRTTIPILSNVLLKASGQSLELKATDLEREVIEEVKAR